ncbi:MAG: hypothetical protein FD148_2597, partial [Methylocystaceae bacterium]
CGGGGVGVGGGGGGGDDGGGGVGPKLIGAGWMNSRNPRQCGSSENGARQIEKTTYRFCISPLRKINLHERRCP